MELARKTPLALPGVTGTARVGRTAVVLACVKPGDIAVIDHGDLDRDTALALVETGVRMVVNAAPFISGRYANSGPEVLAEAGVLLVDGIGTDAMAQIADEMRVRVVDGVVHDAPGEDDVADEGEVLARGRQLDMAAVQQEMAQARTDLVTQMDTLTRTTGEFLQREQELLLNGHGLPDLVTDLAGRPVVVVVRADHDELVALRQFVREQSPALVAVGAASDDLLAESWVPDVVVVTAGDPASVPSPEALRAANDVVLLSPSGADVAVQSSLEAAGFTLHVVESSATAEDLALLLADRDDADLVVGVGLHARLEDFLDQQREGQASSFATRLKVGSVLVDAAAIRALYAGRPHHVYVLLVVMAGLIALLAAVSVTAVGQQWVSDLADYVRGLT